MDTHQQAVEIAIHAGRRKLSPADEPLLELARTLARQMDEAGDDGPGTRLAGTYLTCIRSLLGRLGNVTEHDRSSKLQQLRDGHLAAGGRDRRRRLEEEQSDDDDYRP